MCECGSKYDDLIFLHVQVCFCYVNDGWMANNSWLLIAGSWISECVNEDWLNWNGLLGTSQEMARVEC